MELLGVISSCDIFQDGNTLKIVNTLSKREITLTLEELKTIEKGIFGKNISLQDEPILDRINRILQERKYLGKVDLDEQRYNLWEFGNKWYLVNKDGVIKNLNWKDFFKVQEQLFALLDSKDNHKKTVWDVIRGGLCFSLIATSLITISKDAIANYKISMPSSVWQGILEIFYSFSEVATDNEEITQILGENPTLEEILEVAKTDPNNKLYLKELQKYVETLLEVCPNVNLRILLENLKRGNILSVPQEYLQESKAGRIAGIFSSVTSNIRLANNYDRVIYHELGHATVSFANTKLRKSFEFTEDEYYGLGVFMGEAGVYYFGCITELDKSGGLFLNYIMEMLATLMGLDNLMDIYFNQNVTALANELNKVTEDKEVTKELIKQIDAAYESYFIEGTQDSELLIEALNNLATLVVKGVAKQTKDGQLTYEEAKQKLRYLYAEIDNYLNRQIDEENAKYIQVVKNIMQPIHQSLKTTFKNAADKYFGYGFNDLECYYFTIQNILGSYYLRDAMLDIDEHFVAIGEYIDELGFKNYGTVIVNNDYWDYTDKEITNPDAIAYNGVSLGRVKIVNVKPYCTLRDLCSANIGDKLSKETLDDLSRSWGLLNYSNLTNLFKKVYPDRFEYILSDLSLKAYFKEIGFDIAGYSTVYFEFMSWLIPKMIEYEFKLVDEDANTWINFLNFLKRIKPYYVVEYRNDDLIRECQRKLKEKYPTSLMDKIITNYGVDVPLSGLQTYSIQGDNLVVERPLIITDDDGGVSDIIRVKDISIKLDNLYLKRDSDYNLVLVNCEEGYKDEVIDYEYLVEYPLQNEKAVAIRDIISNPWLVKESPNFKNNNRALTDDLTLAGLLPTDESSTYLKIDGDEVKISCNDVILKYPASTKKVLVTSKGYVLLKEDFEGPLISANNYFDLLSGQVIDTDTEVYETLSIEEYVTKMGYTYEEGKTIKLTDQGISLKYE